MGSWSAGIRALHSWLHDLPVRNHTGMCVYLIPTCTCGHVHQGTRFACQKQLFVATGFLAGLKVKVFVFPAEFPVPLSGNSVE